jgi:hypothetical protein
VTAVLALVLFCATASAQVTTPARPGLLVYNDGEVRIDGKPVADMARRPQRLEAGQMLQTSDGRVELALQPDNYLRVAGGTSVEMLADDRSLVRLRVLGETALEATAAASVELACGAMVVRVERPAMVRLNCGTGRHTLRVYRGRVQVRGGGATTGVRAGRQLSLATGARPVRIARADFDGFDRWNAERSRLLASKRPRRGDGLVTDPRKPITDPDEIERILFGRREP